MTYAPSFLRGVPLFPPKATGWQVDREIRAVLDQNTVRMRLLLVRHEPQPVEQGNSSCGYTPTVAVQPIVPDAVRSYFAIAPVVDSDKRVRQ